MESSHTAVTKSIYVYVSDLLKVLGRYTGYVHGFLTSENIM